MLSRFKAVLLTVTASTGVFALGGCLSLDSIPLNRVFEDLAIALIF